jgi:hypothetical protein
LFTAKADAINVGVLGIDEIFYHCRVSAFHDSAVRRQVPSSTALFRVAVHVLTGASVSYISSIVTNVKLLAVVRVREESISCASESILVFRWATIAARATAYSIVAERLLFICISANVGTETVVYVVGKTDAYWCSSAVVALWSRTNTVVICASLCGDRDCDTEDLRRTVRQISSGISTHLNTQYMYTYIHTYNVYVRQTTNPEVLMAV